MHPQSPPNAFHFDLGNLIGKGVVINITNKTIIIVATIPILISLHVFFLSILSSEVDIKRITFTSNIAEMFSLPRLSRYRFCKIVLRQRKSFLETIKNLEEPVVQAMCWTDPYAVVTVANNPYFQWRSTVSRLVSEVFFDQHAREIFHSSDVMSFVLLVILFQIKSDMIKQRN